MLLDIVKKSMKGPVKIFFGRSCERDYMLSLSEDNQSDVAEAFNSTCQYLDDLLNIDNNYFHSIVNRIYPSELQLNKANVSDTEASFFGFTFIYIGWFY